MNKNDFSNANYACLYLYHPFIFYLFATDMASDQIWHHNYICSTSNFPITFFYKTIFRENKILYTQKLFNIVDGRMNPKTVNLLHTVFTYRSPKC